MKTSGLEIRRIDKDLERPLANFFHSFKQAKDNEYFHPHAFNDEEAQRLANYQGKDFYYALLEDDQILGYGMLRGWDNGYTVPSLGIIIHPQMRGVGMGKLLMHFLHAAARRRGATQVRLKVYSNNTVAIRLYKELGYTFYDSEETNQLVGIVDL